MGVYEDIVWTNDQFTVVSVSCTLDFPPTEVLRINHKGSVGPIAFISNEFTILDYCSGLKLVISDESTNYTLTRYSKCASTHEFRIMYNGHSLNHLKKSLHDNKTVDYQELCEAVLVESQKLTNLAPRLIDNVFDIYPTDELSCTDKCVLATNINLTLYKGDFSVLKLSDALSELAKLHHGEALAMILHQMSLILNCRTAIKSSRTLLPLP